MRGREQHVERKIRLWVAQQERNRLSDRQPGRSDRSDGGRAAQARPEVDSRAPERWRLR